LAAEGEKQAERLVCVQSGTEKGGSVEICLNQNSGLLKAFPEGLRGKILEFAVKRENQGYKDTYDILAILKTLISAGGQLYNPESVKATMKNINIKDSSKQTYCKKYELFLHFLGGKWERPVYKGQSAFPFIPTENEIDQLIAALSKQVGTFCQIAKETGARSGEIAAIKWTDIDFERKLIAINAPEKGSDPRIIKISDKCIHMINQLPRSRDKIFRNLKAVATNFHIQRKRLAYKLNNPRLLKIHLHTFRHWHGTNEYHKTRDVFHVKQRLGHKNIQNTMIYINLEQAIFQQANDDFTAKVANNVEEACKLIEVGFEYVCEYGDAKIFKKRG